MRHYVVVFLESSMFPGTWITDHFVREEEREEIPAIPETLPSVKHPLALKLLKDWQNMKAPEPSWTLEECILGRVAVLTVLTYGSKDETPRRIAEYKLHGILSIIKR